MSKKKKSKAKRHAAASLGAGALVGAVHGALVGKEKRKSAELAKQLKKRSNIKALTGLGLIPTSAAIGIPTMGRPSMAVLGGSIGMFRGSYEDAKESKRVKNMKLRDHNRAVVSKYKDTLKSALKRVVRRR